nr:hypothetical protein [Tanacetum cinerariifolium]
DRFSLAPTKEKCERLEKENERYKCAFYSFSENERQHLIKIKEFSDENKLLKSKVVDCTECQNFQVQVKELKSVNESFNLSIEELSKAREIAEAILREIDELISDQCKKIRLLEEQSDVFHEVHSEDDSETDLILSFQTQLKETVELVVRFTDENHFALKETESLKVEIKHLQTQVKESESLKVEIKSLQTQVKETAELVVRFSYDKYFALKENKSLKVKIISLQTKNKVLKSKESELSKRIEQMKSQVSKLSEKLQISDQEMKQQIILFEEDKRMFLAKNEFLEKVSSSVQKEYNDLLASNDVLKQKLETKYNLLKDDNSLERTIIIIEKKMRDKVKRFDNEKKVFEDKNSKLEKFRTTSQRF